MRIEQLQQIIVIASEGSINKASKVLYLTQSNLSQSVSNLERELGGKIFTRTGSGIELTEFGCDVLEYAKDIVSRFNQLERFCKKDVRPVQIFSISSCHLGFITSLFQEMYCSQITEYSKYSLFDGSAEDICEHVQYQHSELGFAFIPTDEKKQWELKLKARGLIFETLFNSKARICVGRNSPLFDYESDHISLDMLRDLPLVVYEDTMETFAEGFRISGLDRHPRIITVSDQHAMDSLILNTPAFAITTDSSAFGQIARDSEIREFSVAGIDLTVSMICIKNSHRPLSPAAKEFLNIIRELLKP